MTNARRHQALLATIAALVALTAAASLMLGRSHTAPNAVSEAVARALGPRVHTETVRHTQTRGVRIDIHRSGFAYDAGADGRISVATVGVANHAPVANYAHGTQRRTSFGDESVAVSGDKAEIYLTVRKQLHAHTWRWLLDTTFEARVSDSGWVGFFDRRSNKLMSVSMPPVKILNARGHDITPKGLTWGLQTTKRRQYLTLSLDDSKLPLPYTIDPAAYRTNATVSSALATGTFTVTIPATVNAKDLLLVHESGKATTPTATFPTTPTDNTVGGNAWAQIAGTNVAAGTIDQFVWWKWAIAADASKTVTVTIPASTLATITTAAIDVYKGLDSTQTGPQDTGQTNNVTGHRWFTPPAITASGTTAQEHMFLLASGVFASSATTWPASLVAGGTWTMQSSGTSPGSATTQSMAAYDADTAANTAFTATQSGNIFGANTDSATSAFGFTDDVTVPTNSISITNLTGSAYLGSATGSTATLYYKGSAAGNFQLSNALTDAGSGPASSTFPALGGTTTNWSHTAPATVTTPTGGPYASGVSPNNFSWTAGATSSPTEAIVGTDNGANIATTTLTFTNDITATAPTFTFPSNGSVYNSGGWSTISGSGSDTGSGVASDQVSIQDTTVGGSSCWNTGTSTFSAACPNYITATGTTSWTYSGIGSGNLTNGHAYTVTARTTDNVSNTSSTTTSSFTYDSSAPTTSSLTTNGTYNAAGFPSNLTGTATDSGAGGNGISAVNVSVKDSTSGKCWNGTNFTTATCPNWVAVTSGGTATGAANANWSYSTTGMGGQLTDGDTYTVQVQATDATTNGNTSGTLSAGTFKYDASAPTASLTNPSNNGAYNSAGWPGVSGSASDTTAGVGTVKVSIQKDGGANSCWDGTNAAGHFAAACPNWVTATGTTAWSVTLGSPALVSGSSYALTVQTADSATNANTNNSAATATFTYDTSAPSNASLTTNSTYNSAGWPGSVQGTTNDSGTGSHGISGVSVSIQKDGGASACWNGTSFGSACPNWVAVTSGSTATGSSDANWSYTLASTALTSGSTYAVSVRSTDATTNGNQSGTLPTSSFTYDTSAPSSAALTTNGNYNSAGWPGSVQGTVSDSGTGSHGISAVDVSIQDSVSGKCWNGTNFTTAACPNWVAVTSGNTATGANTASWSYTLASGALTDGHSYTVSVRATDATTNGNQSGTLATSSFTYDTSAPSSAALTTNGNYNSAGWPGSVQGTVSDSGTGSHGISAVDVSIQDSVSGKCWNGTNFTTAACPNWVAVTSGNTATGASNASWSYTLASGALTDGHTYSVSVRATDASTSGNQSGALSTSSFTYDTTAPSSATLTTNGNYNSAGWPGSVQGTVSDSGTGSHGVSAVSVSIQKDAGGSACWNGATFSAACPNWVAVTSGNTATGASNASWSYTLASAALTNGSTYAVSVRATDASTNGNQSGALSTSSFTYDTSAPSSAALTTNGNYNAAGWGGSVQGTVNDSGTGSHGISAVDVSIQDSASSKCWNGTNFTTAACPNWVAVTSGNTATGAANASWSYNLASGALTDGHTYTVSVRATDATTNGNQSGTLAGGTFTYDTTGPTHAISLNSASGAYYSSGTLYYKGDAGGSFTLKDAITDATSGPSSVTYPAIATSGWTHNAETVNSGPNYTSATYSWVANPGANPSGYAASALDAAGNTSNGSLTFASDTTGPSVTAPSVTAGYYTSLSVSVTKNGGTDTGGSGVDGTTSILERHEATFSNGSCGSFGATWTTITLIGGADTTVLNGKCYEYREKLTDNVGNQGTSGVSAIVKVDNAGPSNALTLTSVSGGAYKNSTTVYYRGTAAGSVKIRNTVTDSESGPGSSTTASLGGTTTGWTHTPSTVSTPAGGPYDSNTFSWSAGTSSSPTEVVTGADAAGNTTAASSLTFTNDSTAPSVTAPSVTGGYYASLSVAVTLNGGNDTGGSGVLGGSSNVQRDETSLSNGSCNTFPGSWSNVTLTGGADTTVQNGKCYVYREQLTDNVGNVGSSSASTVAKVDNAGPSNSIVLSAVSGGAFKVGTTVYYNGTAAGSFKLTNTVTDAESGAASSATAALGGTSTGWSHSTSTVSTPAGGPYQSNAFSWNAGTSSAPTEVVTGADAAGNTTAASTLTFTNDTTAPSVTAPTVTAGYYTSLSVPVAKNGGNDTGGSGVDATSSILERHEATLSNGSCGSFGATWTTITLVGGADTSVLSGKCYEYREKLSDNVGNQGTSGVSSIAKVDNAGPTNALTLTAVSGGAYKAGTNVYYRGTTTGGGSFTLTNTVADGESGPASSATAALGGTSTGWTHTPSTVSTPSAGPYESNTFFWTQGATSSPTEVVTAGDAAGNTTSSATLTFVNDSTAPSVTTPSVTTGYYTSASVPVTVNGGNDSGSGVLTGSSNVQRDEAMLSNGSCNTFPGSWTNVTLVGGADTSVQNGKCYVYREQLTDHVGNTGSSGTSNVAKVDLQGPTNSLSLSSVSPTNGALLVGSRVFYRGVAAGSFKLTNAVADAESGPTSSATASLGGTTSGWTHTASAVSTPAGGPYDSNTFSWNAGTSSAPTEVVTAADGAGNTTAASSLTFTNDSTAPTGGTLTVNGTAATGAGSTSTSASAGFPIDVRTDYGELPSSSESGLASSTLTRQSASLTNGSCGSFGSATTISGNPSQTLTTGCYLFTLTGVDNVGNTVSVSTTVQVDTSAPSAPTLTISNLTGNVTSSGTTVLFLPTGSGSFDVTASSTDGDSGIAGYTFPTAASMGSGWSVSGTGATRTYTFTPGAAQPGTKNVVATNGVGTTASDSFNVVYSDGTPPTSSIQCNGAACQAGYYTTAPVSVTLSADDGSGGSGVQVIRYTTDGSDPTTVNGSDYTGAFNISSDTTVKFRAYDVAGNAEAINSKTILVDGTAPTGPTLTVTENPASGGQHVVGTTLFYRPGGSGTFRVSASTNDPETGVASVSFPAIANVTGGGIVGSSPYQSDYSWGASTSGSASHSVVATNGAGGTSNASFDLTADSTAPTGQTVTLTGSGAPYYKTGSVTFNLGDGNDGSGSGVDSSSETVTRETATLSGDSCGTFTADPGTFTSPDTSVSNGHCYRYTFTVKDNVGNVSSAVTATAKVDTAAPTVNATAPTELSGAADQYYKAGTKTQYFRSTGSGSFTLGATASDGETAVTGVAFPDVSSTSGWSGSIGGTDATSPFASPTNYTWTSGAGEPASQNVVATDKAGNTATDSITITDDTTAPAAQAITLTGANAPWYTSASVGFSLTDGTDGGSGIDTASRTVTRETGMLSNGSCSGFTADAGTFTSPDTSVSSGHCYRYTFTIKDNVGNVSTGVTATAKVDATSPSLTVDAPTAVTGLANQHYNALGQTLYFRPSGSGSFSLNATSSDTDSAISSVTFPDVSAVSGWTFSSPADYSWSSGASAPGARSIVATNGAGLTASGTITLAADSSVPTGQTISLTGAGAPYYKNTSVAFALGDGSDSGSGLDTSSRTVTRETAPLTGDSCGTFVADAGTFTSPDTSVTGGHCYRYTFTIKDNVGNVSTGVTATAKVDTAAPNATTSGPTELTGTGNQYYNAGTKTQYFRSSGSGSFRLNATATDTHTAVGSVAFPDVSSTSGWSGSTGGTDTTSPYASPTAYSWSSGASEPGAQTFTATDLAGNTGTDSITLKDDTAAPSGQTITPGATYFTSASVTFSLADGTDNVGGSGLDLTSRTVTRETAPLSGDSCGTFVADAGTFTSPDSAVSNGHCYRYTFTESDNVGNVSAAATATVKVDTANPTATLTNPGTPLHATVSLGATASDGETAVQQVAFQRSPAGANSWTTIGTDTTAPFSQSWDTTGLTDGSYDLRAIATDGAGNTTTSSVVANRTVDNTAPNTTIDAQPSNPSNNPTPTFQFSSSEGGSTFECRLDGGSWSPCSSPDALGALSNASHTFDVRATDAAGNTDATPASYTWTVDFVAPQTTIDSQPSNPSGNASPSFTFSADMAGSTFECRVDGGAWSSCSSPDTLGPLTSGSHTFAVRATSTAGNTDPTPASYTWTIDLTAPSVTITAPTAYINAADPSNYAVTATTPDGDVTKIDFYECSNSSVACGTGTWNLLGTDNTAPYGALWTTPNSDGTQAIRAVATDSAGNTGGHVRTITIDRTAPTGVTISYPNGYASGAVTITTANGPDGDVNAASGTIERALAFLTSDSCGTFGGYAPVTSPDTVPSGDCAKYEYHVADNAGNVTNVLGSNVVKRDAAAPTSSVSDPGTNLRQTISLSATASDTGGSDIASVAFQRKPSAGGSWTTIGSDTTAPYSTSFDTTTVTDGLYDLRSIATDVAGNSETSPVAVTNKRIDNTAPSATMVTPGNPVRGSVTLSSTTNDGGSGIATVAYEIAPSGGSFSSQSATWNTTLISDGLYDLRVVATDNAGNTTTSTLVTTRVDNTPPSVSFSSPASNASVRGTVALTASATDASPASPAVTFEYKLHSAPASAYTAASSSWNTTTLPAGDGVYDLRATASDAAGNVTQVANTSIVVDNVPPTISISAPGTTINGSVSSPTAFSATANDAGSGVQQVEFFQCSDASVDCSTGTFSSLGIDATAPYSTSWNIAPDGNRTLKVTATDNAGHATSATRNVSIDTTAPFTNITGAPGDPSNVSMLTFNSSEAGSTFECRIDGGSWNPCTSPHTYTGLTDNQHTASVRSIDAAGNVDPTPPTWTWHRDATNPTGSLNNPGANVRGTVSLTSSETDPSSSGYASGVNAVAYQYSADGSTWATIGIANSAPFDSMSWNTTGVTDGVYQLRIVIGDVAGNVGTTVLPSSVRVDNTPPTTSQDDPGQYLRGTKNLTGSAADAGSGIDHVDFQRSPAGGSSWTTIGTDTTAPYSTSFDTSTVSDGHYDFRTVAVDVAGNVANATPVTSRLVDNTVPTAVVGDPSTSGGYVRGTVTLSSAGTTDSGGANASGIASITYQYSTDGGTTWNATGTSLNTTTLADGSLKLRVIATDNAGNTATSPVVTDTIDNTRPVTTDNAPSGYQASPVTVNLNATDGGSGVNVTEYSVDGGPYVAGTSVTIPAPSDGSNDGAHTIAYFSADNVGNVEAAKSTSVLIDATPPACPSCSAADYLRGNVTLSASPSTGGSGIQSVQFESSPAGANTWTPIGTDTTGPAPYTVDWNTTAVADGHYDLRIIVTDNASNATTTDLSDKVVDNTAPNVATVGAPTQGAIVAGNVGITASAADATSPVASVEFIVRGSSVATDTTAPYSYTWDSTSVADGSTTIQVIVADKAGNTTASPIRTVTVDNNAPSPTLANPGANVSGTVNLTATSDPDTTQIDFERRAAGASTWTTISSDVSAPFSASLDTATLADGLYDFRAVATDSSGNTGASGVRSNVRVDNTAPSGALTAPSNGATVGGSNVALGASASDGGSGVTSVSYERRPTGGSSWTTITTSSGAPYSGTWDTTGLTSGNYDLRAIVTDNAGNTFTTPTITVNVDTVAPTVTLANPGASLSGSATLSATVTGSGATQVAFFSSHAGANAWQPIATDTTSPYSVAFNTTTVDDGLYDLRAVVTDTHGNTSDSVQSGIRIDNTAPRLVSSTPTDGALVSSASSIELVATEAATAPGVTLDGATTVAPVITGTHLLYNTGALSNGLHVLAGNLADSSGKTSPFRVSFTVGSTSGGAAVERNTSSSSSSSLTSADGVATLTVPAGAWSPHGNDWIVVRIDTRPATGIANGFSGASEILDVTAFWALSGEQVHQFDKPLELFIRSTAAGVVPATFDGNWRVLRRTSGTDLPTSWDDGFFRDSSGYHLLTRHLTQFTLLNDVQAPAAPTNVLAFLENGTLSVNWTPGADNSGTYDYVRVLRDGSGIGDYSVGATTADLGPWTPSDTRALTLRETDLAGNDSAETKVLRPVPSIVGLTRDGAASALAAAGFKIGDVTEAGTGRPGTVTGPANLALAEQGAAINLTIAPGSGGFTKFAFTVVSTKAVKSAKTRSIAARVSLTRAASVTTVLYSPRGLKLGTWRFKLKAGSTVVRLRIPSQVRRRGTYALRWTATSGQARITRTIRFRLASGTVKGVRSVVLTGDVPKPSVKKTSKVVVVSSADRAFDAASAGSTGVQVMVVDVDAFGLSFIRDLRAVFPSLKIVAVSNNATTLARATKVGASVALPRSTPPKVLAAVIARLLR